MKANTERAICRAIQKSLLTAAMIVMVVTPGNLNAQVNTNNITHYSELDGNNIFDVLSDQFGHIWLTTYNGLQRFDGYEFTRFYRDPNNSATISNSLVSSLYEDSKGRIWVGGAWDINMYDPKTKEFHSFDFAQLTGDGASVQPWIVSITEHKTGRIFFGALDFFDRKIKNSLFYFDDQTQSIKMVENPSTGPISNVNALTTDTSGNIWGIALNGIIKIGEVGSIDVIKLPSEKEISGSFARRQSVASDTSGRLWISSGSTQILIYDPKSELFDTKDLSGYLNRLGSDVSVNKIRFDGSNNAWIATSAGIIQYNVATDAWSNLNEDVNAQNAELDVISFDIDSFGNIWMGTLQAGLLKYENRRLFNSLRGVGHKTGSNINNGWVSRIFEDSDRTVWLSTVGSTSGPDGISNIDFKNETVRTITNNEIREDWTMTIEFKEHRPGVFYISDLSGLHSLDVGTMELLAVDTGTLPAGLNISKHYIDHNETEWLGTNKGLYERKSGLSEFTQHDLSTQPGGSGSSNLITYIVPDSTAGIWILTNDGLFYYDHDSERVQRHAHDPNLGDVFAFQDINSLLRDENGIVWVGTWSGGLSRYDTNTLEIETFTMADGLPSMSIQYILKDDENNDLWLSTFNGISRFDIDTYQFVNYTTENGLHSQLFTDGVGLKTSDKMFIFGGSNGITYFHPSDISKNSPPPRMFFTDIKINDVSQSFENGVYDIELIILDHDENNISFDYTGIHYSNPARNRFSFILENYDTGWRDVGLQRTAYYPNLPPGNYVFRVKAANSNGVWNEDGISIEVIIRPPWWKTVWAYIFYGFLFGGAIFGVDRFQRRRLTLREQERTRERELRQAKEIEKAFKNLEIAHENLKSAQSQLIQQEKLASLGQLTAGIAHEIKNPLNFVNNFSNVSLEMIDEALEELDKASQDDHTAETAAILADIKTNLTKIHEHGSRADGIVKSMLQHSRGGTGKMEPTDLNALVKEFTNLAYHGMRAGKNPIEAEVTIDLDETIGEIPLVYEDFSRVILNICTNAFDALRGSGIGDQGSATTPKASNLLKDGAVIPTKSGPSPQVASGGTAHLQVRTRRDANHIVIEIEDNGPGIPDDIKDKILQPFFTTKKGTQGTGLGLSITHDIVKAHGGDIQVVSEVGEGTTFIIKLAI